MGALRVTALALAVALQAPVVCVEAVHAGELDSCCARTEEALVMAAAGHLTEAGAALQDILADGSDCARAHAALATLGHETGLIEHPEYYESRAIALAPDDADVIGMLAMSRLARGDAAAARRLAAFADGLGCSHPWGRAVSGVFRMSDAGVRAGLDDVRAAHADASWDPWILSLLALATSVADGAEAGTELLHSQACTDTSWSVLQLAWFDLAQMNEGTVPNLRISPILRGIPDDQVTIQHVARKLIHAGHSGEARRLLTDRSAVFPSGMSTSYWMGLAYADAGRYEDAIRELDLAVLMSEQEGEVRGELARVCWMAGERRRAGRQADLAVHLDSANVNGNWVLASVLVSRGEFEEAVVYAGTATRHDSLHYKGIGLLGLALTDAGEVGEGVRQLRRASHLATLEYGFQIELLAAYMRESDWVDAVELGCRLVGDAPWQRNDDAYVLKAVSSAACFADSARLAYEMGTRLLTLEDAGYLELALLADYLVDKAGISVVMPFLEAAEHVMPDSLDSHLDLAATAVHAGGFTFALCHGRRAVQLAPGSLDAHLIISACSNALGLPEDGERHAREALEIDPGSGAALFDLGHALVVLKRYGEAVHVLEPLVASDKAYLGAGTSLAIAYSALGQVDEALEACFSTAEKAPDGLEIVPFAGLSLHLEQAGRLPDAERVLEEWMRWCIGHDVDHPDVTLEEWLDEIQAYDW